MSNKNKIKILVVSFHDDNFGDNLIKICFVSLLKVVLKNLQLNEYSIDTMPLKEVDENKVKKANVIFFAGGGLIGLSYLNFFEYIDKITSIAEEKEIPVIFSSIGINNMDVTNESEHKLVEILSRKCIKSLAVRENPELFEKYTKDCDLEVKETADPAVWAKYVYGIKPKKSNIVGINVVRGGLFKDNKREWTMTDELERLQEFRLLLDEAKIAYKFYTNGSFIDNNSMLFFAKEYDLPEDKFVFVNTSKELVETIASFGAASVFRMHSSIIAYSLGVPTIAFVWNDKIPFFYKSIGYEERAFELENWDSKVLFNKMKEFLNEAPEKENEEFLMSLYSFLLDSIAMLTSKQQNKKMSFVEITKELAKDSENIDEDGYDLRFKMRKGQREYLSRFIALRRKDKEIRVLKKENEKANKIISKKQDEIDRLNRQFLVKVSKKLHRAKRKFIKKI